MEFSSRYSFNKIKSNKKNYVINMTLKLNLAQKILPNNPEMHNFKVILHESTTKQQDIN